MKILFLFFILFAFYSGLHARDTLINNTVRLSIPKKATRIKSTDIESYRSRAGLAGEAVSSEGDVYFEIDGIIVSMSGQRTLVPLDLQSLKKNFDGMGRSMTNYTSEIRRLNNGEAFIMTLTSDVDQHGNCTISLKNSPGT